MEKEGYIEHGGTGKGTYWTIRAKLHQQLVSDGRSEERRRIDWEAAKTRVLSILMDRAKRGEQGVSNKEIRQVTHYDRNQARRLIMELSKENPQITQTGEKRWTRYEYDMRNV